MAVTNYRMVVQAGMSGTVLNSSAFQVETDDTIEAEVVFTAKFPRTASLDSLAVRLTESDGEITVDRTAGSISVLFPLTVIEQLTLDTLRRVGKFSVVSEALPSTRRAVIQGTIVVLGSVNVED